MHKSRLLELFKALEKSEQRELGKFVRSPAFNQRKDVADLYDYLYLHFPYKDEAIVERSLVFAAIFPDEPFDAAKFDYAMSFLYAVMKEYIVHKEREGDAVGKGILLARALRKRNLPRLFEKEIKSVEKTLENHPYEDAEHHFNAFQLHLEKHILRSRKAAPAWLRSRSFRSRSRIIFWQKTVGSLHTRHPQGRGQGGCLRPTAD
ncbi:MAG: hypothetical protein IPN76_19135 [Saprospiraceae bacterium]|nr:hypothetical protein [Saprospiraceae bacterium]